MIKSNWEHVFSRRRPLLLMLPMPCCPMISPHNSESAPTYNGMVRKLLDRLKDLVGMLIFENFIYRHQNFKSLDSSSTRNLTRHWEMVREWVALTSPHLTHWELTTVQTRLLVLLTPSWQPGPASRQVDVPGLKGWVSSVCPVCTGAKHSPYAVSPDDVIGETSNHRQWSAL